MFKIFTFRQLMFLSLVICIIMFLSALLNTIAPAITTSTQESVCVPIVMYHHICDKQSLWGDYVISTQDLENDFNYFKEHNIIPISFERLRNFVLFGEELPQKCIILTFDDGQKSFLTKVVPLLEEYNYPANINIVGSLTQLYTTNGETNDCYAYLNTEDIKFLSTHRLVEIGCHTYNFHSLGKRRGASRLQNESDSDYKNIITNDILNFTELYYSATQNKTTIFAYPYGIRNDFLLDILKEQNFSVTLTCREAVNHISRGDNLYELGRFNRPYGINRTRFFNKLFAE